MREVTDFGNLRSNCYSDQVPNRPLDHYAPEILNGMIYGSSDIQGIVRIQRMFRRVQKLEKTIQTYLKICPATVSEENKKVVVNGLRQFKNFVYHLTESEEHQMGFKPREFRPLTKHPTKGFLYLGQWRIGEDDVMEGRCVIICVNGALYEGYVKNDQITGSGRSISRKRQAYIGDFQDGKFHGFGVSRYLEPDQGVFHRGFFKNDQG